MDALRGLPESSNRKFPDSTWKILVSVAGVIFIADLALPLGIAGGVPYILVILISIRHRNPQLPFWTASACSLLTIVGIFLSPLGSELWIVLVNRTFALFAIWTTAIMGRLYLHQAESSLLSDKVFLATKDHMSILDRDHRYKRVNPSYEKFHRKSAQEIVGMSVSQLLGESIYSQTVKPLLDRSFQGEEISYEAWFSFLSEKTRFMAVTYLPLINERHQVQEIVVISRDRTEHKKAEEALKASEDQFRDLYESAPLAYFSASFDDHITRVNHRASELLGYSYNDLIGKHVLTLYAPTQEGYEKAKNVQKRTQQGVSIQDEELEMIKKDGSHIWVSLTVRLIYDETGKIIERRGMVQDISARKKIERELRASEYRFRSLVETAGSIIIGLTPDGWIVEWNREAERLYGRTREEVLDKNYFELFIQGTDRVPILADIKNVLQGKPSRDFQNVVMTIEREKRQILWNVDRLVDQDHQPYGVICIGRDITEWENAQSQLQKWATIFQHTQWGVAVSKKESSIFDMVNEAYARMHGYAIRELEEMPMEQVYAPEFRSHLPQIIEQIHKKGFLSFEALHIRKDGTTFPALETVSAIKDLNEQTLYRVANLIDITDRKKSEVALRQSEERFRIMFEQAAVGVAQVQSNSGKFIKINQRYCSILGFSQKELLHMPFQDISHPDDLPNIQNQMTQLRSGEISNFSMEKRYFHKEGHIVWVNMTISPMWHIGGDPSFHMCVVEDITQRKYLEDAIQKHNVELEKTVTQRTERIQELEQRRMQVEKLAALAQIAASVAHEINNPLASISQSLLLLKRGIPPEHPNFHYMAKAEDCIDRIAQITKHLYQLYRPSSPTPTLIDLHIPIHDAIEIMHARASSKHITLSLLDLPAPMFSHLPSGELTQVLCNLIQNGIDASTPEGTIKIACQIEPRTICIEVADQGEGIPKDIISHIFEPFFTTKQAQQEGGMGLGLAISHSLVQSMGGELDCCSTIGQGSAFRITLPRKDA